MTSFQSLQAAQNKQGLFLSASDGKGNISLIWFVPVDKWQVKGWQLQNSKGKVIKKQILPMSNKAMAELTPEEAGSVKSFLDAIKEVKNKKDKEQVSGFLALTILSSFKKARALGLGCILKNVSPGKRKYKIIGLGKNRKSKGVVLISGAVNSKIATPLPPAPGKLKAESSLKGAKLFWKPVKDNPAMPVLTYGVEQIATNRNNHDNELKIIMLGSSWDQDRPAFTDTMAPVEQDVAYNIYSIDAFGRKSPPSRISFFMQDVLAMQPPIKIKIQAKKKKILLSWQSNNNPNRAGYVVERSSNNKGFYETLTLKGLKSNIHNFQDNSVVEGLTYYYRLRSIGTRGDLGEPSRPVKAKVKLYSKPSAPKGLVAKTNPILVSLSWEKSKNTVAGYFVEKRAKGSKEWARLNVGLLSQRFYKDRYSYDSYGTFYYRVTAVAFNNQKSSPSKELQIVKKNLSPPLKPYITSIKSENGRVIIKFEPGNNKNKNISFKVIRDLYSRKEGKVIEQGLSPKKRTFTDTNVIAGRGYWYALAAVDKNNQESAWSDKHLVMVVPPVIPKPDMPKAKFIKIPFSHIQISFKKPPGKLAAAVQRQLPDQDFWTTIIKDIIGANTAVDNNPVTEGISKYRIVYHQINGARGKPSKYVEVNTTR